MAAAAEQMTELALPVDDLLTEKEETIVQAYLTNGHVQHLAWRAGHPDTQANDNSIYVEASRFFKQPKVRLRIHELQALARQRANYEMQDLVADAVRLKAMTMGDLPSAVVHWQDGVPESHLVKQTNPSAAVAIIDKLFKHLGGYEADNVQKQSAYAKALADMSLEDQERVLEGIYELLEDEPETGQPDKPALSDCTDNGQNDQIVQEPENDDWLSD